MARTVLTPEDFGAVGDGLHDDARALQDWVDAGGHSLRATREGKTYLTSQTIFVRRDNIRIRAEHSIIRAAPHKDLKGAVIAIVNCSGGQLSGGTIDVNGGFQNGIAVIGNYKEYPEALAFGPMQKTTGWRIEGVRSEGARFHINNREGVLLVAFSGQFRPGDQVKSTDEAGCPTIAKVVAWHSRSGLLICDWLQNRVGLSARVVGPNGSGQVGPLRSHRISIDAIEAVSGLWFPSWHGKFGGKGISVQWGTDNIDIRCCEIVNCDVGFTHEAAAAQTTEDLFLRGATNIRCSDLLISGARRLPLWLSSASNQSYDRQLMSGQYDRVTIVDPLTDGFRFGAISGNRAHHVTMSDVRILTSNSYVHPYQGFPAIMGSFGHSKLEVVMSSSTVDGVIDLRPHCRWGNAPGRFLTPQGNNDIAVVVAALGKTSGALLNLSAGADGAPSSTYEISLNRWDSSDQRVTRNDPSSIIKIIKKDQIEYSGPVVQL